MSMFRLLGVCAVALVLSACGGGGGGCKLSVGGLACKESATNIAPVAKATAPAEVVTGSVVTLDASGSSDANQDPLTYNWSWALRPQGSAAALSSTTAVQPTFTADVSGTYVLTLTASDGALQSNAVIVTLTATAANVAPVANAGPAQSVVVGAQVTLDGSGSTDGNLGDVLTYSWTLSRPDGSAAQLDSATSAKPKFTADVAGTYLATLTVSDGKVSSNFSMVRVVVSAANAAPVANAGPAQSVVLGADVTLDGSGSSDANLDVITYSWALVSKPASSTAALDSATAVKPKFKADVAGSYIWALVVNDGKVSSSNLSTVTITASAANAAPVANAGSSQNVITADKVTLSGSGSDANGDTLTYKWYLVSKPAGSAAALTGDTTAAPTFVADLVGTYVAVLVVNDGKVDSAVASTTVTAADVNQAPTAVLTADTQVLTLTPATTATLNGTQSTDPNRDALSYRWAVTTRPATSTAALTDDTGGNAGIKTFKADKTGQYIITLIVSDGKLDSPPVTLLITAN